ncbi:MAG: ABC transporter permease, partial [Halanaerobiales bacterium]
NKTLDSLLITPARKSDILLGKTIFGIIFTMITVLLMCFINGIFDIGWNNIFNLIIMIFIGAASFTSVGLLIGAVAESQSSARAIGTILYFPLLFPTLIYNLSDFTRKLARFFPTFYLFRGMEKVLIYRVSLTNLMTEMSILVVFATVFFLLTYIKFKKVRG